MINVPYEADCYIRKGSDGLYNIYCDFFSSGKCCVANYSGKDFTEGLNSVIATIESELKPKEKTLEEQLSDLKAENKKLKNSLEAFTKIENNFEKKNKCDDASNENKTAQDMYNSMLDSYSKIVDKIKEETKDLSTDEYINYLYKLLGVKE